MAATFHAADAVRRIALAAAAATLAASAVALAGETPKKPLTFGASPEVSRGKYLVSVMGCDDCHTPMKMGAQGPEPDMTRRLSGHPQGLKVPGAPPVDGKGWLWAGNATEANFVRSIKEGKHLGVGRPINPPMPWPAYRQATEEDLEAVYAYLKTVPPVKNAAPEYQPPQITKK